MIRYVLDTSALLAYIENEEGSEKVESLLNQALSGEIELFISIVSLIEVFYISWREQGEKIARERIKLIKNLPLKQKSLEREHVESTGKIKATNTLAFADSCIAGLAMIMEAVLAHKDPEYDQLDEEIKQLKLPYKIKSDLK